MSVADNGRGIPVDIHPKTGKSALEVIFTTLHAGGKFDNDAYKVAGGLHGVGASVVNALSKSLIAEVRRDGMTYIQKYRRGKPLGPVEQGEPSRGTGTTVTFTPDPEIFHDARLRPELIAERLEVKTYLNKGLVIQFVDQKNKTNVEFRHDGGVADFLDAVNQPARATSRVAAAAVRPRARGRRRAPLPPGAGLDRGDRRGRPLVRQHDPDPRRRHPRAGHARGRRRRPCSGSWTTHDLVKKGIEIKGEDIREGLTAVLSVCVHEPQFQGQTKGRLNNPEVRALVESMVRPRARELPAQEQERRRRDRRSG